MPKVLIAMSGGVDSSVAAYLMKEKGFECIGATMRLSDACKSEDTEDAARVCERLGMEYRIFDFSGNFETEVIDRFVRAYENGMTPNPCIDCNRYLKFGGLFAQAKALGYDNIATGHYARVQKNEETGRYEILRAENLSKDQSYVLYSLSQEQLAHTFFPLGSLTKARVREIAEVQGFTNAKKQESQDICFVPDGKYSEFIRKHTGKVYPPGDFVDESGKAIGRHSGIINYTIGQRKGLGIALGKPVFVTEINPEENTVTLCTNEELFSRSLIARDVNFISIEKISEPLHASAKIRYNQPAQPAQIIMTGENEIRIDFDQPQRAITKGQSAVVYSGDKVVCGGKIAEVLK